MVSDFLAMLTTETRRSRGDTEKNHKEVSAVVLNVETAFSSPLLQIESTSHAAIQARNKSLARAGEWTTHPVMAAAKQATTDQAKDSVAIPLMGNNVWTYQPQYVLL